MNQNYDPQKKATGARIVAFVVLALLAAAFAVGGIFFMRLAKSPVGSGGGGGIGFLALVLAAVALAFGLMILVPRRKD